MKKITALKMENVFVDCIFFDKKCPANTIQRNRVRLFNKQFRLKFPEGVLTRADRNGSFIQISKKFAVNYFLWLEQYGFSEMSYTACRVNLLLKVVESESESKRKEIVNPVLRQQYIEKYPIEGDVAPDEQHREWVESIQFLMIMTGENTITNVEKILNHTYG